jgi:hypothetical protein
MTRDIGTMAQAELLKWAGQVSITANLATLDREGWDYFLQFPASSPEIDSPLDLRSSRIECLIQVKGIGSPQTKKQVKLSNWEKLVKSHLPTFFLVIDFGKENDPQYAYLIHVWEEWISKVLHRLRELRGNQADILNKKYLYLMWSQADHLPSMDGRGLEHAIRNYVGDSMELYTKKKMEILEKVGDPVSSVLHVTSVFQNIEEMWTELVDFAIGLRDEMPTSTVAIEEQVRFGIPAKRTQHEGGKLTVTSRPTAEVQLIFRNKTGSRRSVFSSKVYTPDYLFPGKPLPEEYMKARILFDVGDVIIHPYTKRASINFYFKQAKEAQSLHEHANLWQLANILQDAESAGFVVEIPDIPRDFQFDEGNLPQLDKGLLNIARAIDNAWFLARYFDIPSDTVTTLGQILNQRPMLEELRRICDVKYPISAVGGYIIDDTSSIEKEPLVAFLRKLVLGTSSIIVSIGLAGSLNVMDVNGTGEQRFQIEKPRKVFLEHLVSPIDESISYDQLLNQLSNKLEDKGFDVIMIRDWDKD